MTFFKQLSSSQITNNNYIYLDVSSPSLVCQVLGGVDLALCAPLKLPVLNPLVSAAGL